jgi:hypothetical protein
MAKLPASIDAFSAELRSFAAKTVEEVSNLRRAVNSRPCIGRTSHSVQKMLTLLPDAGKALCCVL